jgi:hypothetical protein
MVVRYFYAWTPYVLVATALVLVLPWLGLFALAALALVVLAPLAWAVVTLPLLLLRAAEHLWHARRVATPRSTALPPASSREA